MKYDFHIHYKHSANVHLKPEISLKIAKNRGLREIAVTDYNKIKGGLVTQKINDDENFTVIVSSDRKTEYGDRSGIFLQDKIVYRKFKEVVNAF
jgi:predicted metal-dependent phosphoesterase TrpH